MDWALGWEGVCGVAEAETQLCCGFAVAREAKGTQVVEVALASTFSDWADMVCIPERAAAGNGLHAIEAESSYTCGSAGTLESAVDGDSIGLTGGADAVIACEDLIAEVAGVGAKPPLVDTVVGAEGAAAFGEDFQLAPTAEDKTIDSAGEGLRLGAAARQGAGGKHGCFSFTMRRAGGQSGEIGSEESAGCGWRGERGRRGGGWL